MASVDVFVGNNVIIDTEVYHLWVSGYTAHEAAQIQQKRGVLHLHSATFDMLLSDTLDHYRTFAMLEDILKKPTKMSEQTEHQIPTDVQQLLIEKYYEFDQAVMREFLGKKLSSRVRSSLDDVSEKTRLHLRSCRRQFENVRTVFKTVEEMLGSLEENIQKMFLLSINQARKYAAVVFIANNRFETGKRKLQYLTFQDFVFCASQMIVNWSYSSVDCQAHEDMDADIDRDFLRDLRELKTLTEKEYIDEQKMLVQKFTQNQLSPAAVNDLENNFKDISKNILNIANGLNHSKELREFSLDVVEKLIDPWKQAGWTLNDIRGFLSAYSSTYQHMDFFTRHYPNLAKVWERYIFTVQNCVVQTYHS